MIADTQLAPRPLFNALQPQPADALLGLIALYREDSRPTKIDLGVGVYRDDDGATPIPRTIKIAERRLLETQSTKSYLGAEGDARFTERLAAIALGKTLAADPGLVGVQTPGGTGALRLAAELIAQADGKRTVWIGTPTWPNHAPIFREAGLAVQTHPYYDAASGTVDFSAMLEALDAAAPGDIVLIHGCCHNPTGADLSADQVTTLISRMKARGLMPLIDLAYQGQIGRAHV